MTKLGASLLEELLGLDRGHRGPRIDCGAGHQAEFVSYRDKTLDSVLGPIQLDRAYYHCPDCGHGVAPRDGELGITGESMTPGLASMCDQAAAAVPFAKGADLLTKLAGVSLSTKRVERKAEADGNTASARRDAAAAAILAGTLMPLPPPAPEEILYIAVDGTGVPMVAAATKDRPGKHDDGRARTREVKLAALFTQTKLDTNGYPVRDPDTTSYLATLEPVAHFGELVYAEARRRGSDKAKQLVVLGDGAPWIWNLAGHHFPTATHVVDLYHAREHLADLARLLAPALGEDAPAWHAERRAELDTGDVPAILAAAQALTVSESIAAERDKKLGYFQTNATRMRYAHYRELGRFVGSGVVEAGCGSVIGQRLKLSGMRWNIPGATGIATLRCAQASGRWEEIWMRPDNQTSVA